jgi:hypothetical protein
MEIDWNLVIAVLTLIATALIGYFAYNVTKVYSKKSDEHNQDVLFHQLFRDFNARYSDVNFSLQDLLEKSKDENYTLQNLNNDSQLRDKIMDYFNICAEELYWKKKRRIPDDVWNAWKIGMDSWYNEIPILQELWKEEISGDGYKSYYLEKGENLFQ